MATHRPDRRVPFLTPEPRSGTLVGVTASTTLSITLHSTQGTKILVDVADAEADRVLEAWDLELRRTVGRGLVTIADVDGGRLSIPAGEILLMTTEKSAA